LAPERVSVAAAFRELGLPKAIRTDNGVPFASPHALFGLSKLAVWRLRLGIEIERIKPRHPTQNSRHERIHLTLNKEATNPAARPGFFDEETPRLEPIPNPFEANALPTETPGQRRCQDGGGQPRATSMPLRQDHAGAVSVAQREMARWFCRDRIENCA